MTKCKLADFVLLKHICYYNNESKKNAQILASFSGSPSAQTAKAVPPGSRASVIHTLHARQHINTTKQPITYK